MIDIVTVYETVNGLAIKKGVNSLQVNPCHFRLVEVSGIEPLTS